jgi:hypothetical protein
MSSDIGGQSHGGGQFQVPPPDSQGQELCGVAQSVVSHLDMF